MDAGCIVNAWMISYPRPRGESMLVDCCVCVGNPDDIISKVKWGGCY